ncbi:hypothetical protein [Streptococcus macedonicus]|uniref:Uncharacterized protein n=1 Tax=Streptococcus macedonicus TaxID=59310 RepID=A0AA47ILC1_STRMC|nr:hypothetical protein [Streptococcus macedonicus]MCW8486188.1 hypothetical protein [Streptococcus macedonicus]MCW8494305.1 hypothetical protein [Streptococcus macedonicus]MCW8499658.1 hypothetical protein [Streptococcus macedonicus]MCW8501686.1 hypothetical protein [Streptococcus macedonicus]MCW8503753.1 hypothetical protein [Streptococcus macedonicus]
MWASKKYYPFLTERNDTLKRLKAKVSYTNFAFLPHGEWASEFERGETPLMTAVKLVQLVGVGKTHGLS